MTDRPREAERYEDRIRRLEEKLDDNRRRARGAYMRAMIKLQAAAPIIEKRRCGTVGDRSYRFASIRDILDGYQPLFERFKFVISWGETRVDNGMIRVPVYLTHVGGWRESASVPMPISGRDGSDQQRVGVAATYSKRRGLEDVLGMSAEDDTDGDVGDERPQGAAEDLLSNPEVRKLKFEKYGVTERMIEARWGRDEPRPKTLRAMREVLDRLAAGGDVRELFPRSAFFTGCPECRDCGVSIPDPGSVHDGRCLACSRNAKRDGSADEPVAQDDDSFGDF